MKVPTIFSDVWISKDFVASLNLPHLFVHGDIPSF